MYSCTSHFQNQNFNSLANIEVQVILILNKNKNTCRKALSAELLDKDCISVCCYEIRYCHYFTKERPEKTSSQDKHDFQNNHVAIDIWCESLYHYMHKHKNLSSTFPPGHRAVFVVSY